MNFNPFRRNRDLDDELRAHFRMAVEDRIARGESPADAERNARREFGNELLVRETTRDFWRGASWERFAQDVKYAFRRVRTNPGFSAIAILTLTLGIGLNTAVFTLIHAVMFQPLPVDRPHEIYRLGRGDNCCVMSGYQNGQDFALFSYELYKTLRDGTPELRDLAAFQVAPQIVSVRRSGSPDAGSTFRAEYVSSNYFQLLAVRPSRGTFFAAADEDRAAAPRLVLSYRAWQTHFAGDAAAVGSSLLVKGKPFTVIGIAPPSFYGDTLRADPPDIWLPAATEPLLEGTNSIYANPRLMWLYVMGRIPTPQTRGAIEAKVNVEARRWYFEQAGASPTPKVRRAIESQFVPIDPAAGGVETMSIAYRNGLTLLMAVSSLVLLIACANVANLLLARATAMRAQNALKVALGASRARMLRQALVDSIILGLSGGAAGLALAFGATRLIILLAFRGAHYVPIDAAPSGPVLAFAIAVSIATGLLFGIVPAWLETRSDPAEALRGASRSTHSAALLPQKILILAQATVSFVLLTGAALLSQSLWNLQSQHFGFRTDHRIIAGINPAMKDYTPERTIAMYRTLQDRLASLPGVAAVGLASYLPMSGGNINNRIFLEGSGDEYLPGAVSNLRASPGYFEAVGTQLLRGRTFEPSDSAGSPRVAVVNQTFVDRYCKGRDPIGMRFGPAGPDRTMLYQIIGIVEDAKYQSTYKPAYATYYLSLLQPDLNRRGTIAGDSMLGGVVLETNGAEGTLDQKIRATIEQVDSNLGIIVVTPYAQHMAQQFNKERLLATLTQLFATLALVLASIGLYGLVALSAGRRTAEIGVRMALGASRRSVVALILRGALIPVAVGIGFGVPASLSAGRWIQHQLFGVDVFSPLTLSAAAILLVLCPAAAAVIPAGRASRIDPMRALRVE